jgi:hypothetical protein
MGIPEKDTTCTPIATPKTRPEFSIAVKDIRRLSIHFRDQGSASKARPYGMNGAVISWAVLDAPPPDEMAERNRRPGPPQRDTERGDPLVLHEV